MATQQYPKVSKAKARMMMKHPFFATVLIRTPVIVTRDVPLAATDGSAMYYNPDFLDLCTIEDVMCVMAHEVGHDIFLHSLRVGQRNFDDWNRAGDHVINLMLEDQGFKCPTCVPGGWLADKKYKGWFSEKVYEDIRRKRMEKSKDPQPGEGDPQPGGPGGYPGPGDGEPKKGRTSPQNAAGGKPGTPQPGDDWLHGDILPAKPKNSEEQAKAEQQAIQRVAAAASAARMAGRLTGDLAILVDQMLGSKIRWVDVLRDRMLKLVRSRDNWQRRNRRYPSIHLPSRGEKRMGPMIFIPDTSGSMMGDIKTICSEIAHCSMQTHPENIRVVWADSKVKSEQVFEASEFDFKKLDPKGGGGTDMRVPLEYVEKYNPQVVVLLTDGHTPWPDREPPYDLIVLCTTKKHCPVGQVIRI